MFKFFKNFLSTQVENNNQLEEISSRLDNISETNKELIDQVKKLRLIESQCFSRKDMYTLLLNNGDSYDIPVSYSECSFIREKNLEFLGDEEISDILESVVIPFQDSMFDLEMTQYRHYTVDMYFINASQETVIKVVQAKRTKDPYTIRDGVERLEISISVLSTSKEINFEERFVELLKEFSFEEMQSFYTKAYNEPKSFDFNSAMAGKKSNEDSESKEKDSNTSDLIASDVKEEKNLLPVETVVEEKKENLLEDLADHLNSLIQNPDSDELKTNFRKAATKAMREVNSKK